MLDLEPQMKYLSEENYEHVEHVEHTDSKKEGDSFLLSHALLTNFSKFLLRSKEKLE